MSERWSPTLGIVGFDQGTKSAVALATSEIRRVTTEREQPFAPFPIGACCYNDGTCDDITEPDCDAAGGNWQGPDTRCADDPNPCVGVCCEPTCVDNSTPDSCAADGGTWMDFGTTCTDTRCPGACCAEDGSCTITSESGCIGAYQGDGTTCDPNPCPSTGACCFSDGSCTVLTLSNCDSGGGMYQGDGTNCSPNLCPPSYCQPPFIWCIPGEFCCEEATICCHGSTGNRCCTEQCCPDGHCCRSFQFCCPGLPGGCGHFADCHA